MPVSCVFFNKELVRKLILCLILTKYTSQNTLRWVKREDIPVLVGFPGFLLHLMSLDQVTIWSTNLICDGFIDIAIIFKESVLCQIENVVNEVIFNILQIIGVLMVLINSLQSRIQDFPHGRRGSAIP